MAPTKILVPSYPKNTHAERRWPYSEYYIGEEDQEKRRNGYGEDHWSGAESLKWYTGRILQDTLHGIGEYRWRYKDEDNAFITYEGRFYGNSMHGYGIRSFPDGRLFKGLFHKNMRWGPGVESNVSLQENVGLWNTRQLVRLSWQPQVPNVTLDLNIKPSHRALAERHRTFLTTRVKTVGEVNSAIELLKHYGTEPILATQKWSKLYPKHCTDFTSPACNVALFDNEYYGTKIVELEEVDSLPDILEDIGDGQSGEYCPDNATYYSWNNNVSTTEMMKHCFKHEGQRAESGINLKTILNGSRNLYKPPARHELECRTFLMACYLGHFVNVAELINEDNINPDVTDILGNTGLMYAVCGYEANIVHFLEAAGADVNSYNDSCLTPLGVALVKYACNRRGIAASEIVEALAPPTTLNVPSNSVNLETKPTDWLISRDLNVHPTNDQLGKTVSKPALKATTSKKKATTSDDGSMIKKKNNADIVPMSPRLSLIEEVEDMENFPEENKLYHKMHKEFLIKLTDLLSPKDTNPVPYLFEVTDMAKEVNAVNLEQNKLTITNKQDKSVKKNVSKVAPAKSKMISLDNLTLRDFDNEGVSINSADRTRIDILNKNMDTIKQLLKLGADPKIVRCPQPALWIAIVSGAPDLVRLLVKHGADVNEIYPEAFHYSALDIAVAQPLSIENVELVRSILECGAATNHRLKMYAETSTCKFTDNLGPTLLHAVLAKVPDNDDAEECRHQLLKLLLEYNCDPLAQYEGISPIDMAMSKSMNLFQIFMTSPNTDLNAPINSSNQTILVKMFSVQFQQTVPLSELLEILTDLMLYGADPFLEYNDGRETYANIFVFARKNISEPTGGNKAEQRDVNATEPQSKSKKTALKKDERLKSVSKMQPQIEDYKQALALVTDCARMLYIRWIQANLLKELINVAAKFEHRQWNMILPEYKNKKPCGIWLTYPRSLEIWCILQSVRKKKVVDRRILKHTLCIVHYLNNRAKTSLKWPLTAKEKAHIESEVFRYLKDHDKMTSGLIDEIIPYARPYVTPELAVGAEAKFKVCFECVLPLEEQKIACPFCKQVSFCSLECMKINTDRVGCHPCSVYLKEKYFPSPDITVSLSDSI